MDNEKYFKVLMQIEVQFTPSAPIDSKDFFQGRETELAKIVESLREIGQHAMIYGERGIGKTSLANVVPSVFENFLPVVKVSCNRSDTFKQIWIKALDQLPIVIAKPSVGFKPELIPEIISFSTELSQQAQTSTTDISRILDRIPNQNGSLIIFVFDEFDTIIDKKTKEKFADLIKDLSDKRSPMKFLIVGIGHNILELIGHHASIERCIKQIKLKRLENSAVSKIARRGYDSIGFTYPEEIINLIAGFSCGFGHYAHLLSKHIAKYALSQKRMELTIEDFFHGASLAIESANESIKEEYRLAITSDNKENKFKDVLHACAIAEVDNHETFGNNDIIEAYKLITGKTTTQPKLAYNIGKLCTVGRGEVLIKQPGLYNRYRFRNPLLQVYVTLLQYKFTENKLKQGQL